MIGITITVITLIWNYYFLFFDDMSYKSRRVYNYCNYYYSNVVIFICYTLCDIIVGNKKLTFIMFIMFIMFIIRLNMMNYFLITSDYFIIRPIIPSAKNSSIKFYKIKHL